MLFNSWTFLFFLVVVYSAYLILMRQSRAQNILLLAASYVFYGWWDWRFTALLAGVTVISYIGAFHSRSDRRIFIGAIVANLAVLGFFKYFNFFTQSFLDLIGLFGWGGDTTLINIILPVGISFYVFQCISYLADVRRGDIEPSKRLVDFGLYIAFFPQLVAGPIERAVNMLPQIGQRRVIIAEEIEKAIFLILWGLYKKIVIADNLAPIANRAFDSYATQSGAELLAGVIAFTFQIYCDFSAYSDIARGVAKLFGFELMVNFNAPYLARSPSDFWRRWHISLSSWLRDYVYISFGGNRGGRLFTIRNLMLTMLLGGLWHGAAWNFVAWGLYQGAVLALFRLAEPARPLAVLQKPPFRLSGAIQMLGMFAITVAGWIIFRGESMDQIAHIFLHLGIDGMAEVRGLFGAILALVVPLVILDFVQLKYPYRLELPFRAPVPLGVTYAILIVVMMIYAVREPSEFIYFQF